MADHATLRDEPIGPNTAHICVDMQRMYQEDPLGAGVDAKDSAQHRRLMRSESSR